MSKIKCCLNLGAIPYILLNTLDKSQQELLLSWARTMHGHHNISAFKEFTFWVNTWMDPCLEVTVAPCLVVLSWLKVVSCLEAGDCWDFLLNIDWMSSLLILLVICTFRMIIKGWNSHQRYINWFLAN